MKREKNTRERDRKRLQTKKEGEGKGWSKRQIETRLERDREKRWYEINT